MEIIEIDNIRAVFVEFALAYNTFFFPLELKEKPTILNAADEFSCILL